MTAAKRTQSHKLHKLGMAEPNGFAINPIVRQGDDAHRLACRLELCTRCADGLVRSQCNVSGQFPHLEQSWNVNAAV